MTPAILWCLFYIRIMFFIVFKSVPVGFGVYFVTNIVHSYNSKGDCWGRHWPRWFILEGSDLISKMISRTHLKRAHFSASLVVNCLFMHLMFLKVAYQIHLYSSGKMKSIFLPTKWINTLKVLKKFDEILRCKI